MPTTPTPLADTSEDIHLGMTHDDKAPPDVEQGVIDYVWGAKYPEFSHNIHKSFYFKFDRAGGYPGNTSFPMYYDKTWFLNTHPDWLVYLCDKQHLAYEFGDPNVPLDITNPDVLQFMLKTWIFPALDRGYDGIAFDNVNLDNNVSAGRCGIWQTDRTGHKVWKYLYENAEEIHGAPYVTSVLTWAKLMSQTLHAYKAGATIEMNYSPNNGGIVAQSLPFNEQLVPFMDFALDEGGYTTGDDGYTTDARWQLETLFSHDLATQGKGQLLTFGFPYHSLTAAQKLWALSNYLLVKGNHTYLYIASTADNGSNYGSLNLIPEYSLHIGHPLDAFYLSHGVYMRDYSEGKTLVNPSSFQTYTVPLPHGIYTDMYENPLDSLVTLPPHSGLVLLKL